jgi:endonuclease/exonuclease/phosphatase family metal-dependent hydrolase
MKHITNMIILLPVIFALTGCEVIVPNKPAEPELVSVAAWNVQALFDGQEAGNEYDEYRQKTGWTPEKYRARINTISQAIQQMVQSGKNAVPDIIGLVEIENAGVLEDLAKGSLSKYSYNWTAFSSIPGLSLGLGILSRFPITDIKSHSITIGEETAPRPVLEVRIEPRGEPLVFLLCHWKSKSGKDTEGLRRASARVVHRRLLELKQKEEGTPVIIMGDLNENHNEFYLESAFSALLPDDPAAAALAAKASGARSSPDFLVLSGEKPPLSRYMENVPALYSPWGVELSDGSYFYRDKWETIDHFLLSEALFGGTGWIFSGCHVLNHAPFTTSNGTPNRYIPRNGNGLSDHLPLLLYLRYSGFGE